MTTAQAVPQATAENAHRKPVLDIMEGFRVSPEAAAANPVWAGGYNLALDACIEVVQRNVPGAEAERVLYQLGQVLGLQNDDLLNVVVDRVRALQDAGRVHCPPALTITVPAGGITPAMHSALMRSAMAAVGEGW